MSFHDQNRDCHSERSEESETVWKEVSFGLWSHFFSVILTAHERISHSLSVSSGTKILRCAQNDILLLNDILC